MSGSEVGLGGVDGGEVLVGEGVEVGLEVWVVVGWVVCGHRASRGQVR